MNGYLYWWPFYIEMKQRDKDRDSMMNTFVIDGCTMSYIDQGEGEVIVLGHSYLWDSQMWAPQIEVLSQHYRCIVPDLWAHGQSDMAPKSTRGLRDYALHILALMDHLGIEHFSIAGLSVGGMWGAEVALSAPERVKSLILLDTFLGLEPQVTHDKYFAMLDAISQAKCIPQPIVDSVAPLFFSHQAEQTHPQLVSAFREHLSRLEGEAVVNIAQVGRWVFGRRDALDELEHLALPVLIAVGAEDKPRPALESYLMQDVIDGSQLEIIPAAGHISNLEQPEIVSEILLKFFAQFA